MRNKAKIARVEVIPLEGKSLEIALRIIRALARARGKPLTKFQKELGRLMRGYPPPAKYRKYRLADVLPRPLKPGDLPDDPTKLLPSEFLP